MVTAKVQFKMEVLNPGPGELHGVLAFIDTQKYCSSTWPLTCSGCAATCLDLRRRQSASTRTSPSSPAGDASTEGPARNFHHNSSTTIKSIWSSSRCPPRSTSRAVDHSVLARLARSASTTASCDTTSLNFALLHIRSMTSTGHLIQDLITDPKLDFLCFTETWQQPNGFSQLMESTPSGLFTSVTPVAPAGEIIYRENWKVSPCVCACLQLV